MVFEVNLFYIVFFVVVVVLFCMGVRQEQQQYFEQFNAYSTYKE